MRVHARDPDSPCASCAADRSQRGLSAQDHWRSAQGVACALHGHPVAPSIAVRSGSPPDLTDPPTIADLEIRASSLCRSPHERDVPLVGACGVVPAGQSAPHGVAACDAMRRPMGAPFVAAARTGSCATSARLLPDSSSHAGAIRRRGGGDASTSAAWRLSPPSTAFHPF